ncbi:MAG: long-chain fatty acid--CoA ligase, partial [bacterium]|nr:long-chain fatty acid--CoA ligase [bacterium]
MTFSGPPLEKPFDVSKILSHGLATDPDGLALVSAETRWTWRELDMASSRIAGHYRDLGLKKGDRVASLMPNRPVLLVHYLACWKMGLVATPLNYRYQAPEIDHALEVSGASAIFAHSERKEDLSRSKMVEKLPLGVISYLSKEGHHPSVEEFLEQEPTDTSFPSVESSSPAMIFFTSGSTGKPKGVTHSLETWGWMLASMIRGMELHSQNVVLPGSSISHIGGFAFSFAGLATGAKVVVARNFDGHELLPLLREHRPTHFIMLPAALFALVRDHGVKGEDFSSIRLCFSGGDKVSAELEREFTELTGFPIEEGYGMTEIGFTSCNPPSGPNKLGSVGPLYPGYSLSIRDESGKELGIHQEGKLWIKFPGVLTGYWDNPKATEETIQ